MKQPQKGRAGPASVDGGVVVVVVFGCTLPPPLLHLNKQAMSGDATTGHSVNRHTVDDDAMACQFGRASQG